MTFHEESCCLGGADLVGVVCNECFFLCLAFRRQGSWSSLRYLILGVDVAKEGVELVLGDWETGVARLEVGVVCTGG